MSLYSALTDAILPVLSIAVVGYVLGRVREVDAGALATVTIYVLAPALVFDSVATSSLSGAEAARVVVGVVAFTVVMAGLGEAAARVAREREPVRGALVMSAAFSNAGNFGIPMSTFAFGATGRNTAVLYLVAQSVLMYTLGVYLASRSGGAGARAAVGEVFRLPLVYALVVAAAVRALGFVPPEGSAMMRTISLTGDAAIPLMLLLLGVQLANASRVAPLGRVRLATALRLAVAPVVGVGVVLALGFEDVTVARVFVLECAMPAAVTPLLLAVEFGRGRAGGVSGPEYVGTAILATTVLSVPVLAALVAVLQSGAVV